ncbi:ABC transporter ATP-binding protein [Alteromonas flava]|uniref:ABC transporter ATP-binding protein n=1 Tax=Alteromonas flava TaxID=2048003 RepID=UPI000C283A6A|nr:ABC transporter ATP-binding protein [Alteromonas flava]
MPSNNASQIKLNEISQSFQTGQRKVVLFEKLSCVINRGQSYAIVGPSGSGKSSLLMLASGLEKPSSGSIDYLENGQRMPMQVLREDIGFIFQQFHLLPELNALNNVALPLKLRGIADAEQKAELWLQKVGLGHRLLHQPKQLSGGEQQRVAIARALVFEPKFIFADEPTGNLDASSADDVITCLFSCCQDHGAGLILVTHSDSLASRADHLLTFVNGQCNVALKQTEEVIC